MEQPRFEYYQDLKEEKISKRTFIWFVVILISIFSIIFVTNIFFQKSYRYITVNGLSMQPTLNSSSKLINGKNVQDGVYIKLTNEEVDYNDIIIVDKTKEADHTIIKRLLGFGGDKISIIKMNIGGKEEYRFLRIKSSDSRVEVVQEDYISGTCHDIFGGEYQLGYSTWSAITDINYNSIKYEQLFYYTFLWDYELEIEKTFNVSYQTFTYQNITYRDVKFFEIEKDKIFYMGDNRTGSSDARSSGTEFQNKIIGKVVSITHNSTSFQNSPLYLFERVRGYLEVIWKEIIEIFSWKG